MRRRKTKEQVCEAVVIGSGVAGLTAGAYLAHHGVNKGYTFDSLPLPIYFPLSETLKVVPGWHREYRLGLNDEITPQDRIP